MDQWRFGATGPSLRCLLRLSLQNVDLCTALDMLDGAHRDTTGLHDCQNISIWYPERLTNRRHTRRHVTLPTHAICRPRSSSRGRATLSMTCLFSLPAPSALWIARHALVSSTFSPVSTTSVCCCFPLHGVLITRIPPSARISAVTAAMVVVAHPVATATRPL